MPTFEELARRAQGLTQQAIPMPLLVQWANDRVHELLGKRRVAILRRHLELSIPASIGQGVTSPDPGTIIAVRGSHIITGNATASSAWATLPLQFPQGWFFRAKSAWYKVASRSSLTITLESPFAEDSISGTAYSLIQRYHPLPENVYQLEEDSFFLSRTNSHLTFVNPTTYAQMGPGPFGSAFGIPAHITEAEPGPGDVKQLIFHPFSLKNELITYDAYILKGDFTYSDQLPLGLEVQHILTGLIADCLQWQASQPGLDPQTIQILMNEKARQLTRWEGAKDAALMRLSTHQMRGVVLAGPVSKTPDHSVSGGLAYNYVWSRP